MKKDELLAVAVVFVVIAMLLGPRFTWGQSASEIRAEIADHNAQIEKLNKEIAVYEKELDVVGAKKQTLQNTLSQLDLQRKKLSASISVTKNKIGALELEIESLSENISGKEGSIQIEEAGLAETLRSVYEADKLTMALAVLSSDDFDDIWNDIDAIRALQDATRGHISELSKQKTSLTETKTETEKKQAQLVRERNNLVAEQGSLDATRRAQNELLAQTKSEESAYQALLAQKQAAKASFESALNDLQSRLQYTIDPNTVPPAGKGILRWPLDNVKITQYFGNTAFAQSGAYSGKGHNGIDFGASIGTTLRAALGGTVVGTGNTDAISGCYSYGKWVMIKHNNGLSTLYAHMSQINVSKGQKVSTGEVIGYTGNTGYATGPHLHFGVYLSSAVQIIKLGEATNRTTPCSTAVMPVAPLSAYLNPIDYL